MTSAATSADASIQRTVHLKANRASVSDPSDYVLGYSESEHDRLERQAQRLGCFTERLLLEAGVSTAMRVLDLGSGIGDVAMLVAKVVGPAGSVVGVERDGRSVERARERASIAGLANVSFLQADVASIPPLEPFDAIVGRFILQFLPDPVLALRSALRLLRGQGIVALQEVSWAPARAANAHLPLWSACATVVHDALRVAGANTDSGLALHRIFIEADIGEAQMTFDMKMSGARELVLWVYDLLVSVRATLPDDGRLAALGKLDTLAERLEAEVRHSNSAVTSIGVVGAWARLHKRPR